MLKRSPGLVSPQIIHSQYWKRKERFLYYEDIYEDWMLFVVEDGAFYYEIDEAKGTATFGDIVVCPPQTLFRRVVIKPLTFNVLRIYWKGLLQEEKPLDEQIMEFISPGKLSIRHTERLRYNYSAMYKNDAFQEPERSIRNNHFLNDLWLLYCEDYNEQAEKAEALSPAAHDPMMVKANLLIHQQAFEPLHLKDIAAALEISAVQLTKKFKQAYGVTPIHFLTMLRIEKIKKLLLETTLTIDQISECCGYQNGFYLSRIFVRHEGITPSHFRKLHQI